MAERGSGVILTLSTPGSRFTGKGFLGYGATCAAVEALSHLGRLPTLAESGDAAAFVASDRAGAMTGAIANLTGGSLVD